MTKLHGSMLAALAATLLVSVAAPSMAASEDRSLELILASTGDDACATAGASCEADHHRKGRPDRLASKDDDADDAADDKGQDGAGHDADDDKGQDGAGHDAGDDKGQDGAGHDAGDDHGEHGADHDSHDDHGGGGGDD
ncbi:MAG: hypothetical protein ACK50Q_09625 [Labrys sp. (in: a-proteobacteria)]|jgi:hypothetical protein